MKRTQNILLLLGVVILALVPLWIVEKPAAGPDGEEVAIFGGAEGSSGLVAAPTGDAQIVFKVTEVFEPAGADANSVPEDAQASFASGMADDLLDQLVAKLQSEYGVTVNRSAIEQALAF